MMKTLTKNGVSIYLFDDDKKLVIEADKIVVGEPADFIIGDCNSTNTVLHEGVSAPSDWAGHKYFYDGSSWELNPNWVDPSDQASL